MLEVENIHTYYGLSHILFGVSLTVDKGECVCLLGRNGVGKTTTLRSVIGLTPAKSGSIRLNGKEIRNTATHEIVRAGVGLIPEDRRILPGLTVRENLEIAIRSTHAPKKWTFEDIYQIFPILRDRQKQEGVTLSGGEQQMLAIARSLMANPELILVDEPCEGLAPLVTEEVLGQLIKMKDEGITMLCTDDALKLAINVADRVYFMDRGQIAWEGTSQQLIDEDKERIAKLLGAR